MQPEATAARARLVHKLKTQSLTWGDFTLSSGAKSKYYFDCKRTTLDPEGAFIVGQELLALIRRAEAELGLKLDAVGGLTMGADPISLAVGIASWTATPDRPLEVLCVRKSPKAHGTHKLIEGQFREGMSVVVVDDVVTRGDATLKAVAAIEEAGGKVPLIAVLVDREEGGCDKIRGMGYPVVSLVKKSELIRETASGPEPIA